MQFFKGQDVCIAPILEIEELENSDYHTHKGTFEAFTTASGKELKTIRVPFKVN